MRALAQKEMDRLFREVVLVLGGVFAVHPVDDDIIWSIAKGLENAYGRHLRSRPSAGDHPRSTPHPAISRLLQRIGTRAR